MTEITRIVVSQAGDGWRLAFYAGWRMEYEEHFQTVDAAFALAPHIYRERFGDDTRPPEDYYNEHTTVSDQDL